jgi:hypothetical protein
MQNPDTVVSILKLLKFSQVETELYLTYIMIKWKTKYNTLWEQSQN